MIQEKTRKGIRVLCILLRQKSQPVTATIHHLNFPQTTRQKGEVIHSATTRSSSREGGSCIIHQAPRIYDLVTRVRNVTQKAFTLRWFSFHIKYFSRPQTRQILVFMSLIHIRSVETLSDYQMHINLPMEVLK